MISVKYYASEREELYNLQNNTEIPLLSTGNLNDIQNKIKDSAPIFNYASFFGKGIDLYDESVQLGDETDYYGFIPNPTQDEVIIEITFNEALKIENGITIVFNKYSCGKITVERNGVILGTAEASEEKLLPEKVYIEFSESEESSNNISIVFSKFSSNSPINIQGIVLGKIIDIEDIVSFDMIAETNPISDNLAMNETNLTAIVSEDFYVEEGQKIKMFDNEELLEINVLKSAEETDNNSYNFKSRNILEKMDKITADYFVGNFDTYVDYSTRFYTVGDVLSASGINVVIPNEIADQYVSQYLKPSSQRKILQQVAWAACCGIDTTNRDAPILVPFIAKDITAPDIEISNSDGRILKTSVTKGTKYSKIIWKRVEYSKNAELENLTTFEYLNDGGLNIKLFEFTTDEPVNVFSFSQHYNLYSKSPFKYVLETFPRPGESEDTVSVNVAGHRYVPREESVEIILDNKNGETLEISNQSIFPVVKNTETGLSEFDGSKKIAQLKKWYSKNNTLSATVVDNDNEIRVGKIVKIQLKKGDYFQGIVTKVVRNNIGTYHTVDLEAHEWN